MIAPLKQTDYAVTKQLFYTVFDQTEQSYFRTAWTSRDKLKTLGYWSADKVLLGAALVSRSYPPTNCLDYIFVHPEHHGSGIGSAMLDAVLALSPSIHLIAVEDPAVREWYQRRGFHATSTHVFTRHNYPLRSKGSIDPPSEAT